MSTNASPVPPNLGLINALRQAGGQLDRQFLISLARTLRCDWAVHWTIDHSRQTLMPKCTWHATTIDVARLHQLTRSRNLLKSEGMPGHVWKRARPHISRDLIKDMSLPRSIAAHECGLRGGLWFPVVTERGVDGVIELLGTEADLDPAWLGALEAFGRLVGSMTECIPHGDRE